MIIDVRGVVLTPHRCPPHVVLAVRSAGYLLSTQSTNLNRDTHLRDMVVQPSGTPFARRRMIVPIVKARQMRQRLAHLVRRDIIETRPDEALLVKVGKVSSQRIPLIPVGEYTH